MLRENIVSEDAPADRGTTMVQSLIPAAPEPFVPVEAATYDQKTAERAYFERISEDVTAMHWQLINALPEEVAAEVTLALRDFETALDNVQFSTPDRERFVREGVERYREIIINALCRTRTEEGATLAGSLEHELDDERVPNPISYKHLTPQEHMRVTAYEMRKALALAYQHKVLYTKGFKVDATKDTSAIMGLMEVMRDRILRRVDFREYRKLDGVPYELED